jgi:hypothetical protein
MDHPKSGTPDFGRFKCASRVNPTCVVKPAGDGKLRGARLPLTRLAPSALATLSPQGGEREQTEFAARADSLRTNTGIICICITTLPQGRSDESEFAA